MVPVQDACMILAAVDTLIRVGRLLLGLRKAKPSPGEPSHSPPPSTEGSKRPNAEVYATTETEPRSSACEPQLKLVWSNSTLDRNLVHTAACGSTEELRSLLDARARRACLELVKQESEISESSDDGSKSV